MHRLSLAAVLVVLSCKAGQTKPPVASEQDVVATVLEKRIHRNDVQSGNLEALIVPILFTKFQHDNGIVATESEVREFLDFMDAASSQDSKRDLEKLDAEEMESYRRSLHDMAEQFVLVWKTSRAMYEKFGGTVIFQQANPFEPIGAYRTFLESEEKAGAFRIMDAELARSFWKDYLPPYQFIVPPNEVDYSVPWWMRK